MPSIATRPVEEFEVPLAGRADREQGDDLSAAKGILLGCTISLILWGVLLILKLVFA